MAETGSIRSDVRSLVESMREGFRRMQSAALTFYSARQPRQRSANGIDFIVCFSNPENNRHGNFVLRAYHSFLRVS